MPTVPRPRYDVLPLADGLTIPPGLGEFRFEEKMDGVWHVKWFGETLIVGELMPNGEFYAFDILESADGDWRNELLEMRLRALGGEAKRLNLLRPLFAPANMPGGEFLAAVLARGGEGIVAKGLAGTWGDCWTKVKRVETFDYTVAEKHPHKASIRLVEHAPGAVVPLDRGWCPCRAAFDTVTVGDVVEVAFFALTDAGKMREPRFVRVRKDKSS